MRNILNKLMTGTMIAGAALLVVACGGSENATTDNTAMTEMNSSDTMMDGTTNDMTSTDAMMGNDMNSVEANSMDSNMSMDNTSMGNSSNAM